VGDSPPEPVFDEAEARQFLEGVRQFNEGFFFECHDTLEDLWGGIRGPSRDFFQGLIQVSVAFYHLTGGNAPGAESMFRRALKRFEAYPASYFGFDLEAHRQELHDWLARIQSGAAEPSPADLPKWRFAGLPDPHP
jgi:predicted metal-dependent hydrolase